MSAQKVDVLNGELRITRTDYSTGITTTIAEAVVHFPPGTYWIVPDSSRDAVRELVEAARGALDQIREDTQQIDGEWGECRSAADIEDSGDMPEPFYKLRTALERIGGTP